MCQFTLGVKLLSHISHCQTDSWNLRAEEYSFYTAILSHIFKYHLGYVKVWFDNAGSHLPGMTECVLRLSILPASSHPGGVLGALCGQGQQSFPVALVWCAVPSQMPGCLPGLSCFPCCQKFGPTVQLSENYILRSPYWPVWSSLLKGKSNTIKHHSSFPTFNLLWSLHLLPL